MCKFSLAVTCDLTGAGAGGTAVQSPPPLQHRRASHGLQNLGRAECSPHVSSSHLLHRTRPAPARCRAQPQDEAGGR